MLEPNRLKINNEKIDISGLATSEAVDTSSVAGSFRFTSLL